MAGNVWEWCHSLYWPYPYNEDEEKREADSAAGERVLRGGAFTSDSSSLRCAFRSARLPNSRDRNIGFRVCIVAQQE
jgi:formylglycine-generating enzyme required for sulfatase activity